MSEFKSLPTLAISEICKYTVSPYTICLVSRETYKNTFPIFEKYDYSMLVLDAIDNYLFYYGTGDHRNYSEEYFRLVFSKKKIKKEHLEIIFTKCFEIIKKVYFSSLDYSLVSKMFSLFKFRLPKLSLFNVQDIIKLGNLSNAFEILKNFDIELPDARRSSKWKIKYEFEKCAPLLDLIINTENNNFVFTADDFCLQRIIRSGLVESWNVLQRNKIIEKLDVDIILSTFIQHENEASKKLFITIFPSIFDLVKTCKNKENLLFNIINCKWTTFQYFATLFSETELEEIRKKSSLLNRLTRSVIVNYDSRVFSILEQHNLLNFDCAVRLVKDIINYNRSTEITKNIFARITDFTTLCDNTYIYELAIDRQRLDIIELLLENNNISKSHTIMEKVHHTAKQFKSKHSRWLENDVIFKKIDNFIKKRKYEETT